MKKLLDFFRVINLVRESKTSVFSYVPQRGVRYYESLKWKRPEKKPIYDLCRSGDLVSMPEINSDIPYGLFKNSKELESADEKVKKIFSVGYQLPKHAYKIYKDELVEKVKNNPFDNNSLEVKIAKLTANIRYFREIIMINPPKYGRQRSFISQLINKRKRLLSVLRNKDYKKFEWLLETLDLEFRPTPVPNEPVTRKKSLTLLAKLKAEELKEEKLAALRKSYDEQKVPFLEHKIEKLKEIRAKEKEYNLPQTVTDADIEECIQKLEKVKIEVAERAKKGYVRHIHPYTLEPYDKDLLWDTEKRGEKIREKIFIQETGVTPS